MRPRVAFSYNMGINLANGHNIAVLDLGTQTFRIAVLNVEVSLNRVVRCVTPVLSILRHVRLGEGLSKTGCISENAMKRGLEVLQEFRELIKNIPHLTIAAVGTHVLREAQNAQKFIFEAQKIGFDIHIITPAQEAKLTALGVKYSLPYFFDCIVDLGGGSVEFIKIYSDGTQYVTGAPLGCVSLLNDFPELRPPSQTTSDALVAHVTDMLRDVCASVGDVRRLVVAGGAAAAVAFLALELDEYDASKIRGFKITRDLLTNTWNRLSNPLNQQKLKKTLTDRLDILPAGIFILSHILKILNLDEFIVSDSGLLFGLFVKVILKEHLHVEPSDTAGIYI